MTYKTEVQLINQYLISHARTCKSSERILHVHGNAYEIMLFKSGNVDFFINDATYHLKPGDLTFIRPNDIHGPFVKDDSPYERLPVHIEESMARSLCTENTDLLACFHEQHPYLYHLNKEQMDQFEFYTDAAIVGLNQRSFGYDIQVRVSLSMILLLANTAGTVMEDTADTISDVSPKIIRDTITYVNQHFSEDISIQSIASRMHISRSRLCHIFKEFMGVSLWNYVIMRRLQHAQTLLRGGASITSVCYESGFRDYAHFVKTFRKFCGITPGQYGKDLRTYHKDGRRQNGKLSESEFIRELSEEPGAILL